MESKEREKDWFVRTEVLQYNHQVETQAKPKRFGVLSVEYIVKACVVLLLTREQLMPRICMLV